MARTEMTPRLRTADDVLTLCHIVVAATTVGPLSPEEAIAAMRCGVVRRLPTALVTCWPCPPDGSPEPEMTEVLATADLVLWAQTTLGSDAWLLPCATSLLQAARLHGVPSVALVSTLTEAVAALDVPLSGVMELRRYEAKIDKALAATADDVVWSMRALGLLP